MMLKIENIPHELEQISGEVIKTVIKSYEDNESKFSMELELTKMDIENFDISRFRVPTDYEEKKK